MGTFYFLREDSFVGGYLADGVAWERNVLVSILRRIPPRGRCNVVDVGAHIGTHAIPYARAVRHRGNVHAFEPQAVMVDLLRRNVEVNDCTAEVVVHPHALGHVDGIEVSMHDVILDGPNAGRRYGYEDGRPFNYAGLQLGAGPTTVAMRTLDSFELTDVALIKVDAEGSEPLVFWGARETIQRCRPTLVFERNFKTITEAMLATMHVPDEVRNFEIESYTSSIGYRAPLSLTPDLILLRPT